MTKRIVVTGLGTVSPVGNDVPSSWNAIVAGRSGIGRITRFDPTEYRSQVAAEVKDFDPTAFFPVRAVRRMDPFVQYGLVAVREALIDADLETRNGLSERIGVIVGSGIGGMTTVTEQNTVLLERGPSRVSPTLITMILPETAASVAAIEFGLKGPNMAVTSACATGANAIGEAAEMIRRGACDIAVAGGAECGVLPIAVAGFCAMRALSERNDEPERASRPFDKDRDGFVIGEGAGVIILEELEHARARGVHIYAELIGYASNDDAFHITAPDEDGSGATECMKMALASAGIAPSDIDYINAHGTSTPLNDVTETRAIKAALGESAYDVAISSTKSVTGHLLGAAGSVEAMVCVKAIENNLVPPTMNLDEPDSECDLDYVPNVARQMPVDVVLSNSFGFGGHNACLVFRRFS